jgi:hypothetical protein
VQIPLIFPPSDRIFAPTAASPPAPSTGASPFAPTTRTRSFRTRSSCTAAK